MRTTPSQPRVTIRLVCRDLPGVVFTDHPELPECRRAPVYLGIQKGKTVIQSVPADREQVIFEAEFRIAARKDGEPNFLGPFAHGTPEQRFIYLSWGEKKDDGSLEIFRRAKVHLKHLDWSHIHPALESGQSITARLRLTDDKGGPLCGSVRESHITWEI